MREFLDNLASPSWWAGVVVVGILINCISTWLIHWQSAILSRISLKLATRTERLRIERNRLAEEIRVSPTALQLAIVRADHNRSLASLECILGFQGLFGTFLIASESYPLSVSLSIFSGLLTFNGFKLFLLAMDQHFVIQLALSGES